jgi:hypothetical protein
MRTTAQKITDVRRNAGAPDIGSDEYCISAFPQLPPRCFFYTEKLSPLLFSKYQHGLVAGQHDFQNIIRRFVK